MNNILTESMKKELLALSADGSEASPANHVEQIDWNIYLFHYPHGRKELFNLLFSGYRFEVESYKKIEVGIYHITDECGNILVDMRVPCNMTIGNLISYEKISEQVYCCEMEDCHNQRYCTFYHLDVQRKVKGFNEGILLFKTYEKISETFYLLDSGTDDMRVYHIIDGWSVRMKNFVKLEDGGIILELPAK